MNAHTLPTAIGPIPRLSIGKASDIKARREADIEVTNVAVRTPDRSAFLAVIQAREVQLAAPIKQPRNRAIAAAEMASFALATKEAIEAGCPSDLAIAHLETAAARAIALLVDLKGNG